MKEFEVAYPVRYLPRREDLLSAAAKSMGVPISKIRSATIIRRSMDARSREILYRYRVQAYLKDEPSETGAPLPPYQDVSHAEPVIIIGAGPAGSFAALKLLRKGYKPVIIERGKDVRSRKYDIAAISREGVLNPDSNFCFGEGGAGTFSDGKLYTRSNKRGDVNEVLQPLVEFGADETILIDAHPHIGTDRLPRIMENLRKCVIGHGGEYHFGHKVTDIEKKGELWHVTAASGITFSSKYVILATGHSAKDIYELFERKGWKLEAKGFALGVRAEHPQMLINQIQYHGRFQNYLPPAEYSLVEQVDGRGVFSFCMCPGGILVPSSTDSQSVVLNGMSDSARNSRWANAGIVVSVDPADVPGDSPLSLLHFQEEIERKAFEVTSSFKAPAQRMTDFVSSSQRKGVTSGNLPASSYSPGVVSASLSDILPEFVASRLKKAFPLFDRKMHGFFTSEALLLAVESRTSSPVRIPRDPVTLEHISLPGLFPCGEGAGYSGGIVSSAIDGINCAARIPLR